MTDYKNLVIEPLSNIHNRTDFQCGNEQLNDFIKKQAKQNIKRRISRVFVAVEPVQTSNIIGYYTLSTLSIELNHLPEPLARKLPKHPIPAALLGRLAVCQKSQGYGVGKMLLVDAIKRTLAISDEIAIYAMVVDAINKDAQQFYQQFGFHQLSTENQRLFLPLKSI